MAKLEYQRREAFKKHERQAQHHFQQQQRRKREEEERQRHAEYHARKERESSREEGKANSGGQDPGHEKSQPKGKGSGGSSHGSEKPKRPSSLLATNNVMKLKQIIPLQGFKSYISRSKKKKRKKGKELGHVALSVLGTKIYHLFSFYKPSNKENKK
uniref:ANO8 protein n=1 Tax=Micrurus corallinus TaxID=54390 RepID=A0A2D4FNH4_MICCO